jgi:hypothetical protein
MPTNILHDREERNRQMNTLLGELGALLVKYGDKDATIRINVERDCRDKSGSMVHVVETAHSDVESGWSYTPSIIPDGTEVFGESVSITLQPFIDYRTEPEKS